MFNFFSEIKKELKISFAEGDYNIVVTSGKAVYAEGTKGLVKLSKEQIMFKVKDKIISVFGSELQLKEMGNQTICIAGNIDKIEANWIEIQIF